MSRSLRLARRSWSSASPSKRPQRALPQEVPIEVALAETAPLAGLRNRSQPELARLLENQQYACWLIVDLKLNDTAASRRHRPGIGPTHPRFTQETSWPASTPSTATRPLQSSVRARRACRAHGSCRRT